MTTSVNVFLERGRVRKRRSRNGRTEKEQGSRARKGFVLAGEGRWDVERREERRERLKKRE